MNVRSSLRVVLAGLMMLFVAGPGIASSQDKSAVAITSPTDGSALNQAAVDVTVSFSASTGGKGAGGNVKVIQLLVNQQVVATFNNPPQVKSGTHTFPQVDLSAFIGQTVALIARAFQGNTNGDNSTDSTTVNVAVEPQQQPPTLGISVVGGMFDNATLKYNWTVAWSNQAITFTAKVHVEITFFDASNTQVGNKFIPNDTVFGGGGAGNLGTGSQSSPGGASAPVPAGSVTKAQIKVTIPEAKRTDNINIIPDPAERTIEVERQT